MIKVYFLEGLEGKWDDMKAGKFDSFRVPDRKYIKKGEVSRGYVVGEDADAYIKAMKRGYGLSESECLNHVIREYRRVMGVAPEPPALPKVPSGKFFKPPGPRKKA